MCDQVVSLTVYHVVPVSHFLENTRQAKLYVVEKIDEFQMFCETNLIPSMCSKNLMLEDYLAAKVIFYNIKSITNKPSP